MEGYRHILRTDEVWKLLGRTQRFYNWYTKLLLGCQSWSMSCVMLDVSGRPRWDNLTASLSTPWSVDIEKHVIRSVEYKGKKERAPGPLLNFDGMTIPGIFYAEARTQPVFEGLRRCKFHSQGAFTLADTRMQARASESSPGQHGLVHSLVLPP